MEPASPQAEAARARFSVLVEAFAEYGDEPHDDEAMRRLHERIAFARERLTRVVAGALLARPDLLPRGARRIPEPRDGGPRSGAESLLWDACVRYEPVAELLEVYVGEERVASVLLASLRSQERALN